MAIDGVSSTTSIGSVGSTPQSITNVIVGNAQAIGDGGEPGQNIPNTAPVDPPSPVDIGSLDSDRGNQIDVQV